ncbi:MAG: ABC-F family ATP-binding cassette domain-containing protein [Candidatus Moranbacteria bacterium]|nr:ABC-F family ATP-binding cassette domain-containing protein [Candidatus Moranbacteria bacterium]
MLTVRNIFKRYGPVRVLLGADFSVARGQRIALVGRNGVGKSTLLRILAGEEKEDRGEVVRERRMTVSYLPQELPQDATDDTLSGYLRRASGIAELESEMSRLEPHLDDPVNLERYGELRERYDRMEGYTFDRKAERAIEGVGLGHMPPDRTLSEMSGGERRRAALAAALLSEADLLLLDEPTNDLDLPGILWLESYLRESASAVIVASHDRMFLDAVVEKVLEIDWHFRTTRMWSGNYSTYFKEKAEELRRLREEQSRMEDERVRLYETADEKREWARIGGEQKMPDKDRMSQGYHRDRAERKFGAAAKALTTRAEKVRRVKVSAIRDPLAIFFEADSGEDRGIALSGATAGYDGFVAGPVDMDIPYGSHVGLFGRNGAGKSTVLRMVTGELPLRSGTREVGEGVSFGILSQENDRIPKDLTAIEWFVGSTSITEPAEVSRFLGKFLLTTDELSFPMGELSPGERMRLSLAFLMAKKVPVLVLDEPTNHLDLEAVEALADALRLFPGTVILVSHDRAFLSTLEFDQVRSVEAGKVSVEKGYLEYLEKETRKV